MFYLHKYEYRYAGKLLITHPMVPPLIHTCIYITESEALVLRAVSDHLSGSPRAFSWGGEGVKSLVQGPSGE